MTLISMSVRLRRHWGSLLASVPLGDDDFHAGRMSGLVGGEMEDRPGDFLGRGEPGPTSFKGEERMDLNLPLRWGFAVVAAWNLFLPGTAFGDDGKISRAYFVGNSVTDTIRYGSLAKLAESRGRTLTWGRDMIPGAPLSWFWEHTRDGFH